MLDVKRDVRIFRARACVLARHSRAAVALVRGCASGDDGTVPEFARLFAGGNRVRTIGPAEKETAFERGPAADHRRLARRPVLHDPIQLIGPASLVGNSRETFHKSGTDGSNPVPSSGESTFRAILPFHGKKPAFRAGV